MTSSTLFMMLLSLILISMFIYKQRLETFQGTKHNVTEKNIISKDGNYAESVDSRFIEILSTSSSKPGKLCIESNTDSICLDKSSAVSAYTAIQYQDQVNSIIQRLNNDVTNISNWKEGMGDDERRLITNLSQRMHPKDYVYSKEEIDDEIIKKLYGNDYYIQAKEAANIYLPSDFDIDGYRYLLGIESGYRYYPIAKNNNYVTVQTAETEFEPRLVNIDDERYRDSFLTIDMVNNYPTFVRYKTDIVNKLNDMHTEQKRRRAEEIAILQSIHTSNAKSLSDTRSNILRDISTTQNKCDIIKAKSIRDTIKKYEIDAQPIIAKLEQDVSLLKDIPSINVNEAKSAFLQIRDQLRYADEAIPRIEQNVYDIRDHIQKVNNATSIIELTTIQQEYIDNHKECAQYLANLENGATISKNAYELIDGRTESLQDQLDAEKANQALVTEMSGVCIQISNIIPLCNMNDFTMIVMAMQSDITMMLDALYTSYTETTRTRISNITETEERELLTTFIEPLRLGLRTIYTKQELAQTERNKIINFNNLCARSSTVTQSNTYLQDAIKSQGEFSKLLTESRQIRQGSILKKNAYFIELNRKSI